MSMMYQWQEIYFAAVLETDNSKLAQRIVAAENAIKVRVTELAQDHQGTPEEQRAIADALSGLGVLRKERVDG